METAQEAIIKKVLDVNWSEDIKLVRVVQHLRVKGLFFLASSNSPCPTRLIPNKLVILQAPSRIRGKKEREGVHFAFSCHRRILGQKSSSPICTRAAGDLFLSAIPCQKRAFLVLTVIFALPEYIAYNPTTFLHFSSHTHLSFCCFRLPRALRLSCEKASPPPPAVLRPIRGGH